jgi:hypothetical protein
VPVPGRWGEVFGDASVAGAMIDPSSITRVANLSDSDRLQDRDLGRVPTDDAA